MSHRWPIPSWRLAAAALAVLAPAVEIAGQEILLDRPLQVAGVTMFVSRTDPHGWYYLPDTPRIAESVEGLPEFSLVKYTSPAEATGGGSQGITAARGGGVLHMLATYGVAEDRLRRAEEALRAVPERREDRILGPIVFRAGSFALVSSVAREGGMARRVVGTGPAPLLEGGKVAVSAELTPEGASFLWQSFAMTTPDVSLAFSLEIEGYRSPYEAELVADWDRFFKHQSVEARLKILWVGFDVKTLIDECFTDGTIKVEVKGESSSMEALLEAAHAKVVSLLFDPMPQTGRREEAAAGDALSGALGSLTNTGRSYVDLFAGYQLTRQRLAGKARIRLTQQRAERMHALLVGNIGPLGKRWGGDRRFFHAISLEDPAFRQREVAVSFDGDAGDFARAVEHLVVQVEKTHGDGSVTLREALLDPRTLTASGNRLLFAYPNGGDRDLAVWLRYRYRAVWTFRGGRQHDAGWQDADAFALSLRPPYVVRRLSFEGDPEALASLGVRSVAAKVSWDFLGRLGTELVTLRAPAWSRELELVLPADRPQCTVLLTWRLQGGRTLVKGPFDEDGEVVYIDEVTGAAEPSAPPPGGGVS